MNPKIRHTSFGSIQIGDEIYDHDVFISLDGSINKRKKKLSKEVFGTSHVISLAEAEFIYEDGIDILILGCGLMDRVKLSDEARYFFEKHRIKTYLEPTPKAADRWNETNGKIIGLFHITC